MKVKCPHCGGTVDVLTRAPVGSGTRKGELLKTLNANHKNVIETLRRLGLPADVRQVQKQLYKDNILRYTRNDLLAATGTSAKALLAMNEENVEWPAKLGRPAMIKPSGHWNYHEVQKTLSLLVGHGDLEMTQAKDRFGEHGHYTKPVPLYWVKQNVVAV
jgi:hypothetical protein